MLLFCLSRLKDCKCKERLQCCCQTGYKLIFYHFISLVIGVASWEPEGIAATRHARRNSASTVMAMSQEPVCFSSGFLANKASDAGPTHLYCSPRSMLKPQYTYVELVVSSTLPMSIWVGMNFCMLLFPVLLSRLVSESYHLLVSF